MRGAVLQPECVSQHLPAPLHCRVKLGQLNTKLLHMQYNTLEHWEGFKVIYYTHKRSLKNP